MSEDSGDTNVTDITVDNSEVGALHSSATIKNTDASAEGA